MAHCMVEWISVLKNLQLTLTVSHLWGPMILGVIHKFVKQNCIQTFHKSVKPLPWLDGANKKSFFKKLKIKILANLCQKTNPIFFLETHLWNNKLWTNYDNFFTQSWHDEIWRCVITCIFLLCNKILKVYSWKERSLITY
jgi:hypothetical protein